MKDKHTVPRLISGNVHMHADGTRKFRKLMELGKICHLNAAVGPEMGLHTQFSIQFKCVKLDYTQLFRLIICLSAL